MVSQLLFLGMGGRFDRTPVNGRATRPSTHRGRGSSQKLLPPLFLVFAPFLVLMGCGGAEVANRATDSPRPTPSTTASSSPSTSSAPEGQTDTSNQTNSSTQTETSNQTDTSNQTETSSQTEAGSGTGALQEPKSGAHHVVWDRIYLGLWDGSTWSGPETVFDEAWQIPENLDLIPIDGESANLDPVRSDPCVTVDQPVAGGAVSNLDWSARPRTVSESQPTEAHAETITQLLQTEGLTDPNVQISQVLTLDLEGDGTNEVLIAATTLGSVAAPISDVGDYSIIALRHVVNGQLEETTLSANVTTEDDLARLGPSEEYAPSLDQPLARFEFVDTADLNGDGTTEIVLRFRIDHAGGFQVFDIDQSLTEPSLNVWCGW